MTGVIKALLRLGRSGVVMVSATGGVSERVWCIRDQMDFTSRRVDVPLRNKPLPI